LILLSLLGSQRLEVTSLYGKQFKMTYYCILDEFDAVVDQMHHFRQTNQAYLMETMLIFTNQISFR
jgi:hypothetical protein